MLETASPRVSVQNGLEDMAEAVGPWISIGSLGHFMFLIFHGNSSGLIHDGAHSRGAVEHLSSKVRRKAGGIVKRFLAKLFL